MTHSRKQEHQSGSRPQTLSSSSSFDPGNLAMARARENFEKARALTPHRQSGGSNSISLSTKIYPRSEPSGAESPPPQSLRNASSGASIKPIRQQCLDHSEQRGNVLNISSDSSLDEVLKEAERYAYPALPPPLHSSLPHSLPPSLSLSRIRRSE